MRVKDVSAISTYAESGLTTAQVKQAQERGESNRMNTRSSRSFKAILRTNLLTIFNAILVSCMVVVLLVGQWQDAVFGVVMVANILIGTGSELRAKRTLDKLAILQSPKTVVVRDGKAQEVPSSDVVTQDVICLNAGDQVVADGEVRHGAGLRVDESMLTGESVPVAKQAGDSLMSGTTIVAGNGVFQATAVGRDAYAGQLTAEAKQFTRARSEIAEGIDRVLKWISWVIVPMVCLLVWSQLRSAEGVSWQHAVVLAIAGVVGMIPQGLVLLTSMNFALASAQLARQNVLVQELNAVEVLARVDRLCLDKTGTLTTGTMTVTEMNHYVDDDQAGRRALAYLVSDGGNDTARAVKSALEDVSPSDPDRYVAFDSSRKWSAMLDPEGTWFFGAPEILLKQARGEAAQQAREQVDECAKQGARVVCLVHSKQPLNEDEPELADDLAPVLLVVLQEEIRSDAEETLQYFREQEVGLKVISGDNPTTVGALAQRVKLCGDRQVRTFDAREFPQDEAEARRVCQDYDVFGRVTPDVKRKMVKALQADGHTVAMTGDGVNDVLALKAADLGIAMGSGTTATKAVAKVVLVDGKFSKLPGVVAQGRRIIANMERVSSLFLTKTFYVAAISAVVALMAWRFPFLPRQMTIISSLTIGIPSFFLALAPNKRRYTPGFLQRTLALAVPSAVVIGITALVIYRLCGETREESSTAATLAVVIGGLYLLGILSRPLVPWRIALLTTMAGLAVVTVMTPMLRTFFALQWPSGWTWLIIALAGIVQALLLEGIHRTHDRAYGTVTRIVR